MHQDAYLTADLDSIYTKVVSFHSKLSGMQRSIVLKLYETGEMGVAGLSRSLCKSMQSVSRSTLQLQKLGLVTKEDTRAKRVHLVSVLTPKGKQLAEELKKNPTKDVIVYSD